MIRFFSFYKGSLITLSMAIIAGSLLISSTSPAPVAERPVFLSSPTPWADSLIHTLTLDQKIGQLFMVAGFSDPKHPNYDPEGMDLLIRRFGIGGIIFFQGSPVRQAQLTNRHQTASALPLMIGMDAEWGLGMRLDSTISYPRQMTLGAIQDPQLIYDFGKEMSRQLRRLGVHVSFSPVVDVNNNPKNPVISNRSFGEDKKLVAEYSYMYMKGLQDGGVLASAKHFPGHGDTDTDSHKDLPVLPFDPARLDSVELYPYKYLISRGLGSIMIAHLSIPALDDTPNIPSTLSPQIVNGLLQQEMGFEGLIFTDALNMQGVAKFFPPGETDLLALRAGNDVLLYPMSVPKAVEKIKAAVDSGLVTEAYISEKCLKILRAKEWMGLHKERKVAVRNLVSDLNNAEALALQRRIVERSITVVKNNCNLAPVCHSDNARVAVLSIGAGNDNRFARTIQQYAKVDVFTMDKNPEFKQSIRLHDTLSTYDLVIAGMMGTSNKASKNFGVSNEAARIINSIGAETNVVLSVFANPYALLTLKDLRNVESLLVCYQDDSLTRQIAAEIVAGACTADGRLPVSAGKDFQAKEGIALQQQTRLRWVSPSYIGICSDVAWLTEQPIVKPKSVTETTPRGGAYREDMMTDTQQKGVQTGDRCFAKVDSIAKWGIQQGAYPGCRILAAKDGFVIYDKSFGYLDWDKREPVTNLTVYDLASVTKIASTTLAVMSLVDRGELDVNKTLGDYLEIPSDNAYAGIVIRDMLAHQAGLVPWIPFYTKTIQNGVLRKDLYASQKDPAHSAQIADGLFFLNSYRDTMWKQILSTPLSAERSYKYSDLAFYFMQLIAEKKTDETLDTYVFNRFYKPMGLGSMGYQPLKRMPRSLIAPTEFDRTWRKQHILGYVHDQGAAMLGGVAGHAGLFGTAQDLAAVMQMLLNRGTYAGKEFLSKGVVDQFNRRYYPGNRRGLGFDKPTSNGGGSACSEASQSSFGHTGFTGTMCWADPETGIVYVFLSNRVNPDAENKKLQELDIRSKIQSEFYKVMGYGAK
jgi:beta-N-acetylhexosaminidase